MKTLWLLSLSLAVQLTALADQILYQTGFEPPAFTADLPLAGQERWEVDLAPEAISISTNNARNGTQSLRFDGAWLAPQASGYSLASAYLRAAQLPSQAPAVIVEITASVRLNGPQTGTLGTPEQDEIGASILAYALTPAGTGDLLGALKVSSGGRIWNISRVAEDNYRYSVPYTLGTWRTLAIRVDFQARRLTWLVDGVELGSGPFAASVTSDRLFSGSLFVIGNTDPKSTPDYNYDPANYTAYFDDYSLKSIPLEGPALLVEEPIGTRLANGASTVDFGNPLASSSREFTLRNAGNAPLQGVTVTVEGTHATEFTLTRLPSGTLTPGGNTSFTITFTPAAEGPRSTTLRIDSNDPDDNPFTVALTGRRRSPAEIVQQAYLKASNTGANDNFDASVAVSGDTLVVTAPSEDSNATGMNGNQSNNSATNSGAVYVFVRTGTNWTQQAYLKASNTGAGDQFGGAVAIDGDTIVVGAVGEDSGATGVNGNQADNGATDSGAVYVFVRTGTNWTQQAYLKASNTGANDIFGSSVGVSGDTIVVGAYQEDSIATGVNGNQPNNSATDSGAAYVFVRTGTNWMQQAYLKASNTEAGDVFGVAAAVSGDILVVGAPLEASNATGVNGNQIGNSAPESGAVYVFVRNGTNWSQQAYLKASNNTTTQHMLFGVAVGVSGNTVVVGAGYEDGGATGVNGNQFNFTAPDSGAAYVFVRSGTNWTQQAYLKASNTQGGDTDGGDNFGWTVSISGETIVCGSPYEDSSARGVNGNQANNSAGNNSGAAYVFVRTGTNWSQQAYLKASNADAGDLFSGTQIDPALQNGVAVSGDTVVVGAFSEFSNTTGVNGNQGNNSAVQAGAAYVFTGVGPIPPELRLSATRNSDILQLTATGTANTRWRLEYNDALSGTNAWQALTNITVSAGPFVLPQPLTSTNRFFRGVLVP